MRVQSRWLIGRACRKDARKTNSRDQGMKKRAAKTSGEAEIFFQAMVINCLSAVTRSSISAFPADSKRSHPNASTVRLAVQVA